MMGLTVVGVVMRYVFHRPILGANELIELTSVALVMLALPYCTARREHITVDIFDAQLGRFGRLAGDVIGNLTGLILLWFLVRQSWHKALEAHEFEDVTNMIEVPIWPFFGVLALGAALYFLVLITQLILLVVERNSDD